MRSSSAVALAVLLFSFPCVAQAPAKIQPGGIVLPRGKPLRLPPGTRSVPLVVYPPAAPAAAEIQCAMTPDDTIFPSMLLASANIKHELPPDELVLGDGGGDNAPVVLVKTKAIGAPIKVTITCDDVMDETTFSGTLAKPGVTYVVRPKIRWKYKALAQIRQQTPVNIVFRVKVGDAEAVEQVRTCSLRTINDCPLQFMVGEQVAKVELVFAAYVNEDHPWVDSLLKSALATGVVTNFLGYQEGTDESVLKQVEAIWRALQRHNFAYSSITTVAAPQSPRLSSQHVRFLEESIAAQQANCIDGTVMIASILRKIGINSRIVTVPGHAFLAIDLDPAAKHIVGLETTCIGQARLALGVDFEKESAASFQRALAIGTQRLTKDAAHFGGGKPEDNGYVIIDIAAARQYGVRPIPYMPPPGKEQDGPPRLIRIR